MVFIAAKQEIILIIAGLLLLSGLLSTALTYCIRLYGLKHLLDIPNQRSSHQIPTPRGGGVAIVFSFYVFLAILQSLGMIQLSLWTTLLTGLAVAAIGFWDDHQPLAARWRFMVHIGAAILSLCLMPGLPVIDLGWIQFDPGWAGYIVAVPFIVWNLNLFNFMDGIDGLAGTETVFFFSALAVLIYPFDVGLSTISALLSFCSLGFLVWNCPPAKIFMGDAGSGFLGFIIAVMILLCAQQQAVFLPIGLILFAVFISDAGYTLIYRMLDGQKWYEGHCTHAYQHVARLKGHGFVVLCVLLINVFWLLPLSLAVYYDSTYAIPALGAAYIPLLWLAVTMRAGQSTADVNN